MKYPTASDIAEMQARGYDPLTIDAAQARADRWTPAKRVCEAIEKAFTGVVLAKGIGLREAQALDDYAGDSTQALCRAKDEKDDWRKISAEDLNNCHASLSYFDAEGIRFHLPAFLLADLHGKLDSGMAYCLTHFSVLGPSRFSLLSPKQRAAVRAFLLHIVDDCDYEFDRAEILRALNDYWTEW